MDWLRRALKRLGWPVDSLSDEAIAHQLYRRWFTACDGHAEADIVPSVAAAGGIFVTMAGDGNLDALCWCNDRDLDMEDCSYSEELVPFDRSPARGDGAVCPHHPERRQAAREPARDFVDFTVISNNTHAGGWLVDVSSASIAFIAETGDVPAIGSSIMPTIRRRGGGTRALSPATIVRTELLTGSLILVCARLEESCAPL